MPSSSWAGDDDERGPDQSIRLDWPQDHGTITIDIFGGVQCGAVRSWGSNFYLCESPIYQLDFTHINRSTVTVRLGNTLVKQTSQSSSNSPLTMQGPLVQDKGKKKAHSPSLSKSTINKSGKEKDSERKAKISFKGFYECFGPASLLWFKDKRTKKWKKPKMI